MVASIAQKVLGSVLGKYIDGFDKNNINVGILSGAFQIENVALKKEISNMFNLPFNLKFNHIGKIKAKIPWRNLSNSPVEVELEDIMVIAEPSLRRLIADCCNIYKDREKMLEDFASNLEEKFKKGGKEESAGYFSGLITKSSIMCRYPSATSYKVRVPVGSKAELQLRFDPGQSEHLHDGR
jgi:vacuolar protein sorting-associated protein 13A/C